MSVVHLSFFFIKAGFFFLFLFQHFTVLLRTIKSYCKLVPDSAQLNVASGWMYKKIQVINVSNIKRKIQTLKQLPDNTVRNQKEETASHGI